MGGCISFIFRFVLAIAIAAAAGVLLGGIAIATRLHIGTIIGGLVGSFIVGTLCAMLIHGSNFGEHNGGYSGTNSGGYVNITPTYVGQSTSGFFTFCILGLAYLTMSSAPMTGPQSVGQLSEKAQARGGECLTQTFQPPVADSNLADQVAEGRKSPFYAPIPSQGLRPAVFPISATSMAHGHSPWRQSDSSSGRS